MNRVTPAARRLPDGFGVRLHADVEVRDRGRLLVGGSPVRAMTLRGAAQGLLHNRSLVVRDALTSQLAVRLLDADLAVPVLDGPGPPTSAITVVIPVKDRPEQLDRALSSIGAVACIVVDDGSSDPRALARVVSSHGAQLWRLERNVGPAGARNAGLALARTPFVAFVDSDVQVDAATLRRLARHFADPAVAIVGPLVRGVTRRSDPRWFERYDAEASSLTLGRRPAVVRHGSRVGWLPAACLMARRDALGDGFAPGMRVGEDVDLIWRTVQAGHMVRYDPGETAEHDTRGTLVGWLGRKYVYGTGGGPLGIDHGDRIAPAIMSPPMAIAATAVLMRRRWSWPVAAVACLLSHRRVERALPRHDGRRSLAARLVARGLGWALRQESALLVRHWSPLVLVAGIVSVRLRRALFSALLVDVIVERLEPSGVDPVTAFVARRLDDLAYGTGLVVGSITSRTSAPLVPRAPRRG